MLKNPAQVKAALAAGANVNGTDKNGWTALMYGPLSAGRVRQGHPRPVRNSSRGHNDDGKTALMIVMVLSGDAECAKLLLDAKADVKYPAIPRTRPRSCMRRQRTTRSAFEPLQGGRRAVDSGKSSNGKEQFHEKNHAIVAVAASLFAVSCASTTGMLKVKTLPEPVYARLGKHFIKRSDTLRWAFR